MRRMLFITLSVLLSAALLAACGGDDGSAAGGTTAAVPGDDADGHTDDGGGHAGGGHDEASDIADDAREIPVTASSFAFEPDEIHAQAGEDVAIVLTSTDILHDFTIDEMDAHVAAAGGDTATGGFRADQPGRYTYYCSVAGHREAGMEGTLVVEG